jgi:serine protease Do
VVSFFSKFVAFFMARIFLIAALVFFIGVSGALFAQEDATAAVEKSLANVIARNERSVVAIARVRRDRADETFQLELRIDAFGRRTLPLAPPLPTDADFVPNEYGAGVVVGRGLILTAAHLLSDDSDYYVTTADRKTYKAAVRGADPRSDLAVLTTDAADLPAITFGDAEGLKKGQIAISLGNPHAIARDGQASASWGIIANLHRKASVSPTDADATGRAALYHYGTLIQTDAKWTLGASGGPLLNLRGEMIGLSVALAAAPGQEAVGGYAIPVDAAFRRAVEILKQGREVEYGFLGIQPATLQPQELRDGMQGIRVSQVIPGTPAARYGLRAGDIVVSVDGTPLYDADGLILHVGKLSADAVARLKIIRDGTSQTLDVTLSKFAVRGQKIVTATDPAWRGLRVEYLTAVPDENGRFRTMPDVDDAVIVTEVADNSPTAAAGLRRGMLITHVDHSPIRTPKDFAAAVTRKSGIVELRIAGDTKNPVRAVKPAG